MKRRAITGLDRSRYSPSLPAGPAFRVAVVAGLASAVLAGCSGTVSSGTVRQQVAELGGANLDPDDIQVQRIVDQLGGRTVAEANVRLTFQFEEGPDGQTEIVAVRLGDRNWLDVTDLLAAIEAGNVGRTQSDIEKLAAGLGAYRDSSGELPALPPGGYISDVLHPGFMRDLVRNDAWGGAIAYDRTESGFELRSPGPDGTAGNTDDIVVTELPAR